MQKMGGANSCFTNQAEQQQSSQEAMSSKRGFGNTSSISLLLARQPMPPPHLVPLPHPTHIDRSSHPPSPQPCLYPGSMKLRQISTSNSSPHPPSHQPCADLCWVAAPLRCCCPNWLAAEGIRVGRQGPEAAAQTSNSSTTCIEAAAFKTLQNVCNCS